VVLSSLGNGTFGVEYIYESIGFTNGFGAQAQVGVTDGGTNDFVVPGSGDPTALGDFDVDTLDTDSPDGTWDLWVNDGTVVCFLEGTLIGTDRGPKPVQWLSEGDLIATADHGFQPAKRVLNSKFVACAQTLPVRIAARSLDNEQDLFVSPNHRVLMANPFCELLFGAPEVFVAAKHLAGLPGVSRLSKPQKVSYYHLLLEQHEVVYSNGHPTESFFAGDMALLTLERTREAMADTLAQFDIPVETARPTLRSFEAQLLVDLMLHHSGRAKDAA
jgi:hypothetical protein